MKSKIKATIMVPTTGDRGELLSYSIGSIQNQTIRDFEIFVMGDGVSDESREFIKKLQEEDSRIRFFDHPKHKSRGEPHRHEALQQAKGEIVCYLCDRDLMLPNHLETMAELLKEYNFVSTTFVAMRKNRDLFINQPIKYFGAASDNDSERVQTGEIPLSSAAHTLKLYHQLPHGWRTTPKGLKTDVYMWKQFLAHPECKAYSHIDPTILYFGRKIYPGDPVEDRSGELTYWSEKINDPTAIAELKKQALKGLLEDRLELRMKLNSTFLIKGFTIRELFPEILRKASNLLKKP